MKSKIMVFDPPSSQYKTTREIFETVGNVQLICPHGHVAPGLYAEKMGSEL
jgi:hypothetical protein